MWLKTQRGKCLLLRVRSGRRLPYGIKASTKKVRTSGIQELIISAISRDTRRMNIAVVPKRIRRIIHRQTWPIMCRQAYQVWCQKWIWQPIIRIGGQSLGPLGTSALRKYYSLNIKNWSMMNNSSLAIQPSLRLRLRRSSLWTKNLPPDIHWPDQLNQWHGLVASSNKLDNTL